MRANVSGSGATVARPSALDVEFTVSTNPGAPFGALTKIASGGELSRFILALKVALAEAGGARVLGVDEPVRGRDRDPVAHLDGFAGALGTGAEVEAGYAVVAPIDAVREWQGG